MTRQEQLELWRLQFLSRAPSGHPTQTQGSTITMNESEAKALYASKNAAHMRAPNQGGYTPSLQGQYVPTPEPPAQEISPLASVIRDLTDGCESLERAIKRLESKLGPVRWIHPQAEQVKPNRPTAGGSDVVTCLTARVEFLRHLEAEVARIIEECEV